MSEHKDVSFVCFELRWHKLKSLITVIKTVNRRKVTFQFLPAGLHIQEVDENESGLMSVSLDSAFFDSFYSRTFVHISIPISALEKVTKSDAVVKVQIYPEPIRGGYRLEIGTRDCPPLYTHLCQGGSIWDVDSNFDNEREWVKLSQPGQFKTLLNKFRDVHRVFLEPADGNNTLLIQAKGKCKVFPTKEEEEETENRSVSEKACEFKMTSLMPYVQAITAFHREVNVGLDMKNNRGPVIFDLIKDDTTHVYLAVCQLIEMP
jgi:hypothetical protein